MKSYETNACPICTKGFKEHEKSFRDWRNRRWHYSCCMTVLGEITRIDEDRDHKATMSGKKLYTYKVHASAFKKES